MSGRKRDRDLDKCVGGREIETKINVWEEER